LAVSGFKVQQDKSSFKGKTASHCPW